MKTAGEEVVLRSFRGFLPQIVFFTFTICVGLKGGVFQSLVKLFYDVTVGFIMEGKSDIAMDTMTSYGGSWMSQ